MKLRTLFAWAFPITGLALMLIYGRGWQSWQRLAASTLGLLYLLKITILLLNPKGTRNVSPIGLLLFMTVWPGMDPSAFQARQDRDKSARPLLWRGVLRMGLGLASVFLLTFNTSRLGSNLIGWFGIAALLLTIHLGYSDILTALLRMDGWKVRRLFDSPFQSSSLREFWGKRWNLPFIEMDHVLFFQPLKDESGVTVALVMTFAVSGLLHEMGISYPAWRGWGLPFFYFALQAVFMIVESKFLMSGDSNLRKMAALACILVPLPLLFHEPFRDELIVPLFQELNRMLRS